MSEGGAGAPQRIVALDVGGATVGMAFSAAGGAFPDALPTLRRRSRKEDLDTLEALCRERSVELLLVGYPLTPGGEAGLSARLAANVARKLAGRLGIPALGVDERYTSREAGEMMRGLPLSPHEKASPTGGRAGRPGKSGPPDDHGLAAVLILRRWAEEGEAAVLARWAPYRAPDVGDGES